MNVRVYGRSPRQAMCRLLVSNPELLRDVYERFAEDCAARGHEACSFEEFESGVWEDAK